MNESVMNESVMNVFS